MKSFDRLMLEYYRVLINAWRKGIKDSAYYAIKMLSEMPQSERIDEAKVDQLMLLIEQTLGEDFMMAVRQETKVYTERCFRIGLKDVRTQVRGSIGIDIGGLKNHLLLAQIQNQNMFWLGKHFGDDISQDFRKTLTTVIEQGFTKDKLAKALEAQFGDLEKKGAYYWQGLAEHTALRVREFGRLAGYEKAGAKYYKLVNPMDDRTSEICIALITKDEKYPVKDAIEIRDKLMAIDVNAEGMEDARERIKALAPWVKESQIERDEKGNPTGVSGAHTPFPPFHWKCRTETVIVEDDE